MKLTRVWIVTKPTPHSTLEDICFETDLGHGLAAQYRGGLEPNKIFGFYDTQHHAEMVARRELAKALALAESSVGALHNSINEALNSGDGVYRP